MDGHLVASGSSFVCVFPISDSCFLNVRDSQFGNNKKYVQLKYKDYAFHLSDHSFAVFLNALKNPSIKKTHLNTTTWLEKQPDGIIIKRFDAKTVISYDEARSIIEQSSDIQTVLNSDQSLVVMASTMLYENENQEGDSDSDLSEPSDIDDGDDDINGKDHPDIVHGEGTKTTDVHNVCNDTRPDHTNQHPTHQEVDIIDLTSDDGYDNDIEDNDIDTSNKHTSINDTSQQADVQKAAKSNENDKLTSACSDSDQSELSDASTEPITDQSHDKVKFEITDNNTHPITDQLADKDLKRGCFLNTTFRPLFEAGDDHEPPKKIPQIFYYIDKTMCPLSKDSMKLNDTQPGNDTKKQGNSPNGNKLNQSASVCPDFIQSTMMDDKTAPPSITTSSTKHHADAQPVIIDTDNVHAHSSDNSQSALMDGDRDHANHSDNALPVLMVDKTIEAHDENARSSFNDIDDNLKNESHIRCDLSIYNDIDTSHDLVIDVDTNDNMNGKI